MATVACQRNTPVTTHATVTDSAGIAIVSNATTETRSAPWVLDTTPAIDLGSGNDNPHEEFSGSVIPVRLRGGQIVVANSGSSELRYFDSTGTWLKNVGRPGQGPGEFSSLGWLAVGPADTLHTYDWGQHRVSLFSPDGAFLRSFVLAAPNASRSPIPLSVLASGTILATSQSFATPRSRSGVTRDTTPLFIYGEAGTVIDSFGHFPGSESLIKSDGNSVMASTCPYGKDLAVVLAPTSGMIYAGSEDAPEIAVWTPEGSLLRLVRWHSQTVPITEGDRAAYVRGLRRRSRPGQEQFLERLVAIVQEATLPRFKPAYAGVVAGPRGTLWVQAYTDPEDNRAVPYQVFDSTGQSLGTLSLPPRFAATQVGEDFVLGTWKDSDDVTHVRLYRLAPA